MEHRTTIRDYVIENFLYGETERAPKDADSFLELGMIDSTGILELVAFLEDRFQITVGDEEMVPDNLDSIDKMVRYIEKKIMTGNASPVSPPGNTQN